MKQDIQELLIQAIAGSLKELNLSLDAGINECLDFPTDERFGDLTSNVALRLSKLKKEPPVKIAKSLLPEIERQLAKRVEGSYVRQIKIEGAGFINFYLDDKYHFQQLAALIRDGAGFLKADTGRGERVLVEFVSANPTGPLSVAHARQAAVGDSLSNILEFLGFEVKKEYYLNDEGNQINILGKSVELRLKELAGEGIEFPENYYQGDYIYDIAKQVKKGNEPDLGDFAANYILDIIKKELTDFGVRFDNWFSQKELRKSGKIEKALELLKQKGFIYEEGGALWLKSTQLGDDKDRVVIKSDGSYTYLAPDIAYHQEKYKRGFNWLINLWGPDHHGYISRLKAAVMALGFSAESLTIVIVQLASIFREGKSIEMSTRKGQYITLREVLDEVGLDAARFFFMMRRTSSHLDFDLDIAKKQTPENPVYYVQYAYARICSILESGAPLNPDGIDLSLLTKQEEMLLIKKCLRFPYVLHICYKTQDPYMVTVYLQELAEAFHKFYDAHRVLGQAEALTQARLGLITGTKAVLETGLTLLGVSKPEKM